jgi:hypothetical protein
MKTFIFSMLLTISSLSATAFFGGSQGSILDAAATLESNGYFGDASAQMSNYSSQEDILETAAVLESNGYFGDASAQMETYYLEELVIEIPDM